jgi:NADH dehydrogenase
MALRVMVTGGSGFVGAAVIDELLARGHAVTALVNSRAIRPQLGATDRLRSVSGGLFDAKAVDDALAGCQAVIHLVGIIMQKPSRGATYDRVHVYGTRAVLEAARRNGVRRLIHMSALGTRPDAVSDYHKTKYQAEELVRGSGLDWTILRPSLIHGVDGEFMKMEAAWARRRSPPFLFMPYFGGGMLGRGGAGKLQPVSVGDVARAFVDAVETPRTIGELYMLGGPDQLTWPELHRACARAIVGKERPVIAVPAWYARLLTRIVPGALLPFNRDQVIMSQEDNTCDLAKLVRDFGWTPQSLEASLRHYADRL